jgi:hypothetical protein
MMKAAMMAAAGLLVLPFTAQADITVRAVALAGEPAPGLPAGYTFGGFRSATIDDEGNIAVVASVTDAQAQFAGIGLWAGPPHALTLIARSGEEAAGPGLSQTYGEQSWFAWISGGSIAFSNRLASGRYAIFGGQLGSAMIRIAGEGDPAIGGGTVYSISDGDGVRENMRMQSARVVFTGYVTPGPTQGRAVWGGPIGAVQDVARQWRTAPGLEPGATFGSTVRGHPAITSDGTAYFTMLAGNREVIWSWNGGSTAPELTPIVYVGQPAPSFPGGTFSATHWPVPDGLGGITFRGNVNSEPSTLVRWAGRPGNWRRLIAQNDPVPGAPGYTYLPNHHVFQNRHGQFVVASHITGPGMTATWAILTGTAHHGLRVRWGAGAHVPGTSYGMSLVQPPTINDAGQIAFTALVSGQSLPPYGGPLVLWASSRGVLHAVAVTGRPIEVAPGVLRTIDDEYWLGIWPGGSNDGSQRSLSSRGELIFTAVFTGGTSGVLIATLGDETCYPNCDQSTVPPILNVDDFTCFINEFATAQFLPHQQQVAHYANCDGSTVAPVLNVDDFTCFINAFAAGCP